MVEFLPNRHKALGSTLSPHKTKYGGFMPIIPEPRRRMQENQKFRVILLHRELEASLATKDPVSKEKQKPQTNP